MIAAAAIAGDPVTGLDETCRVCVWGWCRSVREPCVAAEVVVVVVVVVTLGAVAAVVEDDRADEEEDEDEDDE
jgi:hypothetical protein